MTTVREAIPLAGTVSGGKAGASRKRVWLVLALIATTAIAGGAVAAYLIQRPPREDGSVASDSTISPEMREIDSTVTTSGTVRLRTGAEVRVGSQVSGIVRKLNVTVGSHIQKGDIIAEIDPRPLQARVEQARTQTAMDEVGVGKAQRDLNRGQQLFAEGVLP
jgi:multidrug efflux pump subunit AcrA (membrane-fusion protein)